MVPIVNVDIRRLAAKIYHLGTTSNQESAKASIRHSLKCICDELNCCMCAKMVTNGPLHMKIQDRCKQNIILQFTKKFKIQSQYLKVQILHTKCQNHLHQI